MKVGEKIGQVDIHKAKKDNGWVWLVVIGFIVLLAISA